MEKASTEYAKCKAKTADELSKTEKDFVKFIDQTVKALENKTKR